MNKLLCGLLLAIPLAVQAETVVDMQMVDEKGTGESVGSISISESLHGLVFTPMLHGMTPGVHGFHLHQNGSCAPGEKDGKIVPGLGAGGHYDPEGSGKHSHPWGVGHLGDLPALYVDAEGKASTPVLAPRPKMSDLKGRALIIHAGGDNHSDHPMALGGGGGRVACGLIP